MAILELSIYPDPVLREETEAVENFDAELHTLLDNMRETMLDADGVGLAAPQVGIAKKITVIDVSESRSEGLELINPEILESEGSKLGEEGCLSIPDYREKVKRAEWVKVKAQDRSGESFEFEATGLLAVCVQHELDHLNGVLFVDHLSRLKRDMFKRWAKKHLEE